MNTTPGIFRFLPVLGFATLILTALAGLARLGFPIELPPTLLGLHGLAMVSGFLGLVIGCERAVAMGKLWGWSTPLLAAAGTFVLLAGHGDLAWKLYTLEAACFVAVALRLWSLQHTLPMGMMAVAALSWLAGNLLYSTRGVDLTVILAWAGFPIWTVVAERLELAAGARVTRSGRVVLALVAVAYFCACVFQGKVAVASAAFALLILGPWLLRYDVARLHLKHPGERRFLGISLISSYAWISIAGPLAWLSYQGDNPLARDAFLHALFLGFLFSMIFAHALLILPALTGKAMVFGHGFYGHLGLLHVSLIARVFADLSGHEPWRRLAAVGNVLALILFVLNNFLAMRRAVKLKKT